MGSGPARARQKHDLVIGVLALQGDVREHMLALAELGVIARPVRRPAELDGLAGIVLPGGESTTIMNLLTSFELVAPLRAAISAGLPVYGSCAGMILLADRIVDGDGRRQTLGGLDIAVRRNAFGRQIASFERDLEFTGVPGPPIRAVFIRAPWVEHAGPRVQILAQIDRGDAEAKIVAVRQDRILATSFHPEVTRDTRVHEYFVDMVCAPN
ncbi:MAG: pyridoxal 5'-phosphate synthase glutaminase subunit PdxT [Angustibacter sp.]